MKLALLIAKHFTSPRAFTVKVLLDESVIKANSPK